MTVYFCWDLCLQVFWKYHMTEAMCSKLEWVKSAAQKKYVDNLWNAVLDGDLLSRNRFRKQLSPHPLPNYCAHTHTHTHRNCLFLYLSLPPSTSFPPRDLKNCSSHIWQAGDAGDGGVWPNVRALPPWALFCVCAHGCGTGHSLLMAFSTRNWGVAPGNDCLSTDWLPLLSGFLMTKYTLERLSLMLKLGSKALLPYKPKE